MTRTRSEIARAGEPVEGIVAGRLTTGGRFFARTPREILGAMEREEFVGKAGTVKNIDAVNVFDPR